MDRLYDLISGLMMTAMFVCGAAIGYNWAERNMQSIMDKNQLLIEKECRLDIATVIANSDTITIDTWDMSHPEFSDEALKKK